MYRIISNSNIETDDLLEVFLRNRGIKDVERFLEPSDDALIHYSKLKNIDKAVEVFMNTMKRESSELAIVVDSDPDGNCSAAMLVGYIRDNFPQANISLVFHNGKQHGLTPDVMKELEAVLENTQLDLLLLPDSGSGDFKQHKVLFDKDVQVIVLDHHPTEKESEYAIVVNNQLSPEYENKQLSGAGVVLKFLEALDDVLGAFDADEYKDLAALGNLADSMSLVEDETRAVIHNGLKKINNKFLQEIINKNIVDKKLVYPQSLSFNVIPKINGIIRVGSMEEKKDLFNAFCGVEETFYNTRTKKNETLPQKVARLCTNAHSRQKKTREKWVSQIREQIETKGLNQNAFLLIELDEKFDRELGGLIAGQLAGEYRKPVLMMIYDKQKKKYSGSLRGFDGAMKNTKDFLEELNLFEYVMGHQNAAGFSIKEDNYKKLNDAINNKIEDALVGEQLIDVDFYLKSEQLTVDLVEEVFQYEHLWGKGAEKPLFVTEIEVDASKIKKSNSSNMIEWYHNGDWNNVKFVQFNGDKRLINLIEDGHKVKLTLVGSLSVSYFAGRVTPQFLIEGIEIGELISEFTKIETKEVDIQGKKDLIDDLFDW